MSNKLYYKTEIYDYKTLEYFNTYVIETPQTLDEDYIDYLNLNIQFKKLIPKLEILGKVCVITDNLNNVYYIGRVVILDNYDCTLKDYRASLDMPIRTDTPFTGVIEDYLSNLITSNYITSDDPFKNINNLSVVTHTSTNGTFNWEKTSRSLESIIQLAFTRFNIKLDYTFNLNTSELIINIIKVDDTPIEISSDNSDTILNLNIESILGTTKCIIYEKIIEDISVDEINETHTSTTIGGEYITTYYLKFDGSLTQNVNDVNRIPFVNEEIIDVDTSTESAYDKAYEKMSLSNYNHEIKLSIKKDTKLYNIDNLEIGTNLIVYNKNLPINTIITGIEKDINNIYINYTLGVQRITITNVIKKLGGLL